MTQGTIDAGERDRRTVVTTAHRPKRAPIANSDLLPFMVLLGAVYGWVVVTSAVVVAAILLLVN